MFRKQLYFTKPQCECLFWFNIYNYIHHELLIISKELGTVKDATFQIY